MIAALMYSLLHLFVGILAAVLTVRRCESKGINDGCLSFSLGILALLFWPLAYLILALDWAVNAGDDG